MPTTETPAQLLAAMLGGERRALARLLSLAESEPKAFETIAEEVAARAGRALRVGITGPGGVGKSTLVDVLVRSIRATRSETVAVLATDPTSERTGGALLGDRIRFAPERADPGLFFRSAATRGAAGGLSHAGFDQVDLLDAFGFAWVVIEAVGAGQSEIEIAHCADVTIVVFAPDSGDAVQAMKAGLMEAGDIFCINKADLPGAERAAATLRAALELTPRRDPPPRSHPLPGSVPPVVECAALEGRGIETLLTRIAECAELLRNSGEAERRRKERLRRRVLHLALEQVEELLRGDAALERALASAAAASSPHRLAREWLARRLDPR